MTVAEKIETNRAPAARAPKLSRGQEDERSIERTKERALIGKAPLRVAEGSISRRRRRRANDVAQATIRVRTQQFGSRDNCATLRSVAVLRRTVEKVRRQMGL